MSDTTQLEAWVEALAGELGIDTAEVDVEALLDIARDAAHSLVRPAAPITTFLVGYAVAQGSSLEDVSDSVRELARRWVEEMPG
ncbi:DUF6457 domain-containing protein [Demequina sp. NBRC 110053]|uniref:DUF6457 domain-containing protein n=1 Tax=Demequina sp. NBRC 110053 TaxID=1570342 RepID=UPI00190EFCD3|nr:DUF6457 domain-containing protein [Demequina sp. NBRC 110053]